VDEESLKIIDKYLKTLRDELLHCFIRISLLKGSFPKFNKEKYLEGGDIKRLPEEIRARLKNRE